jgi:hypothetical protein
MIKIIRLALMVLGVFGMSMVIGRILAGKRGIYCPVCGENLQNRASITCGACGTKLKI